MSSVWAVDYRDTEKCKQRFATFQKVSENKGITCVDFIDHLQNEYASSQSETTKIENAKYIRLILAGLVWGFSDTQADDKQAAIMINAIRSTANYGFNPDHVRASANRYFKGEKQQQETIKTHLHILAAAELKGREDLGLSTPSDYLNTFRYWELKHPALVILFYDDKENYPQKEIDRIKAGSNTQVLPISLESFPELKTADQRIVALTSEFLQSEAPRIKDFMGRVDQILLEHASSISATIARIMSQSIVLWKNTYLVGFGEASTVLSSAFKKVVTPHRIGGVFTSGTLPVGFAKFNSSSPKPYFIRGCVHSSNHNEPEIKRDIDMMLQLALSNIDDALKPYIYPQSYGLNPSTDSIDSKLMNQIEVKFPNNDWIVQELIAQLRK